MLIILTIFTIYINGYRVGINEGYESGIFMGIIHSDETLEDFRRLGGTILIECGFPNETAEIYAKIYNKLEKKK